MTPESIRHFHEWMRCLGFWGECVFYSPLSSTQFIVECHGSTLLPQFLGMYRLTVDGDETYMIVTRNVFSHRLSVYKKYDLKVSLGVTLSQALFQC